MKATTLTITTVTIIIAIVSCHAQAEVMWEDYAEIKMYPKENFLLGYVEGDSVRSLLMPNGVQVSEFPGDATIAVGMGYHACIGLDNATNIWHLELSKELEDTFYIQLAKHGDVVKVTTKAVRFNKLKYLESKGLRLKYLSDADYLVGYSVDKGPDQALLFSESLPVNSVPSKVTFLIGSNYKLSAVKRINSKLYEVTFYKPASPTFTLRFGIEEDIIEVLKVKQPNAL